MAELLRSKYVEKPSLRAERREPFTANTFHKACPLCQGRMYISSKRCADCNKAVRGLQWATRAKLQEMIVRDTIYAEKLNLRIKRLQEALVGV